MPLLEVEDLSIALPGLALVQGFSFAIERGERFGLIGESGSGKSLTALAMAGLLPQGMEMSGSVSFEGAPLPEGEKALARFRGRHFGLVFQEPMTALNPLMRIGEQVAEAIAPDRRQPVAAGAVADLLVEVGLEPGHAARFPHQLSGGQRQRAMIAMALAGQPDLLIADEPTSALDLVTQRLILDLLAEICDRRGMALLFISHDLRAVAALCSRVLVIRAGRPVETGTVQDVFHTPRNAYTRRLVSGTHPIIRPLPRKPLGGVLLETRGLTRRYGQGRDWLRLRPPLVAVDNVDLAIREGESVALVGPSGCGKTTLARMIVGLERASSGSAMFDGRRYRGSDLPRDLRRDLSLVFQDPFGSFDPRLRVGDSVGEPLRLLPGLGTSERAERLAGAVKAVGLKPEMLERFPHEFSGGQRQRLAIARALVTRPRLVVLDEPVSALDVSIRGEILALLNRLRAEFGLAYLLISHDLDMVRSMADRVMVMERGRIVEAGDPAELFARPQHRLTRTLIAARLPDIG